jgi:hypothetical protein
MEKESMELKTTLDKKTTEKFMVVKEQTGMKDDKSVLAFLISEAYHKIQDTRCRKLYVTPETYDLAEKKATAQGQTVDIYVQELIEDQIRKPGA